MKELPYHQELFEKYLTDNTMAVLIARRLHNDVNEHLGQQQLYHFVVISSHGKSRIVVESNKPIDKAAMMYIRPMANWMFQTLLPFFPDYKFK